MVAYLAYRFLLAALPHVPRHTGLRVAAALGILASRFSPHRGAVAGNVRRVLGVDATPGRVRSVTRDVFRNQAKNYFDLFHFSGHPADRIARTVRIVDLDTLLAGQRDGRGTVAVTAHFGNLDIVGLMGPLAGIDAVAVAERLRPERLYTLVTRLRARTGLELVPADRAGKHLLRALRMNRMVVLAADRDVSGNTVQAPFFGAPARVPDGYARLAHRTGARVLVLHAQRLADDTFVLDGELLPPFERSPSSEEDIARIVRAVLTALEPAIARAPEQWVLFRPLWYDETTQPTLPRRDLGRII